jgi:glycosyltransferase involved in cell wall biosynthesis
MISRGIAIATYNRGPQIGDLIESVLSTQPENCRVVVCDDGSDDSTSDEVKKFRDIIYVRGPNLGVIANKNRALWSLQDCHFIVILEDDLFPTRSGWFNIYEDVCLTTGIQHFCRVQDKELPETVPDFSEWLAKHNYTPIYGPSPRGDMTFLTKAVIKKVGGFNPGFRGAGYGHGEWSDRVVKAGLVPHPLKWVDIKEARDSFIQKGDTVGGRWLMTKKELKAQLKKNGALAKKLRATGYVHQDLVLLVLQ